MFSPLSISTFRSCNGLARSPCCLYGSSCCLGCDAKNKLMKSQTQTLKPCMEDNTWTSSGCDMDKTRDSSIGNTSHSFINHGFLLWTQSRQEWIGNKRNNQKDQPRKPKLSKNATYDGLLGSNKPFAEPVPLPEMVNFLVDVWEEEGLYD